MQEDFNAQTLSIIRALYIFGLDKATIWWICFVVAYLVLLQNSLLPQLDLRYFFNSRCSQTAGIKSASSTVNQSSSRKTHRKTSFPGTDLCLCLFISM